MGTTHATSDGTLYQLWNSGVRGKAFLLFRSYFELTTISIIIDGRVSDSWESTLGLLQGSVLSMLLSALYLSSLQLLLELAGLGARWKTVDGNIRRTNSRFYVDDGLIPAETRNALQQSLDIVSTWARKWRARLRIGPDKTAFMCTGGNDPERQGHVYITMPDGTRAQLQAVSCYVYLGLPIQSNLNITQLLSALRTIGSQRTWALIQLAAKHMLLIPQLLIM